MLVSKLKHNFKAGRRLILILFMGLLAVGVYDGWDKSKPSENAHENEVLLRRPSTNGSVITSFYKNSTQVSRDNSFDGFADSLIASFVSDTVNEDERIYPQISPFYSSFKWINNVVHLPLASAFLQCDLAVFSLTILSTVVILH